MREDPVRADRSTGWYPARPPWLSVAATLRWGADDDRLLTARAAGEGRSKQLGEVTYVPQVEARLAGLPPPLLTASWPTTLRVSRIEVTRLGSPRLTSERLDSSTTILRHALQTPASPEQHGYREIPAGRVIAILPVVPLRPTIIIEPYHDEWPSEFATVESLLGRALGGLALRIDHIGSTSVPGLAAKDIVDVQVTVANLGDGRLTPAFERLGATATDVTTDHRPPGDQSPPSAWEKRYYRPPESWRPTHLHVREEGRPNQRYALLFRDYLRQSPTAAGAYSALKTALARLHPNDPEAYYDVKDPACDLIMDAAERWAADVAWRPEQSTTR